MKVSLTGNARMGLGGQGVCLASVATGLSRFSDLTAYCLSGGLPGAGFATRTIPKTGWVNRWLNLPLIRRRLDWIVLFNDWDFDRQVARAVRSEPCDLIVGVAGQSDLAFRAAKAHGAKVWLYCLNSYLPFMQEQIRREVERFAETTVATMNPRMLRRFLSECAQAERILVLSEVAKRTFCEAGIPAGKVEVLTPFVDTERFQPAPKPDSVFRVLYVGTVEPRKGVQYLIEGFERARISGSQLLIVGGTATRGMSAMLERARRDLPNVQQEYWDLATAKPAEVYGRASVLVLPSVEDGFGLVALEAMASGVPVIVTSSCGAADLVEEGVNGFVIPPRDGQALAERLTFLSTAGAAGRQLWENARKTALKYDRPAYQNRLESIFHGATGPRR
jgi:glycosyltransferase involved in cell wall biosynthesis